MLKKLRRKILLINLVTVSIVLSLAVLMVCAMSINTASQELFRSLRHELLATEPSELPPALIGQKDNPPDLPAEVPHIQATLRPDSVWDITHNEQVSIDSDSLIQALVHIQTAEKDEGILIRQRLAYVRRQTDEGLVVILGDTTMVRIARDRNLTVSLLVIFIGSVLCFFISLVMSGVAVRPVEQAWKQQKQFVADASHELKTPLTILLANHNIITSHPDETVRQQEQWLNSTAEEAKRMHILLDEMLTLAKTEDEQFPFSLQSTDISALVEEEVLYLEPVAYEAQILLESRVEKYIICHTDPHLLKKLLVILVDNAVKHGSPNTPVTITLTADKQIKLSVHNYGAPIPPEDLPHLFDRFYRSDKSRSTDGYGLGLSIAQSITEKLKGTLTVTSTEADGTTFTATFRR